MISPDQVCRYQYLWDGSQPGWVLTRQRGNQVDLSLTFGAAGPSAREFVAVRRTLERYKTLPLNEVVQHLRGQHRLAVGRFEPKEARAIAASCRIEGLNVVESVVDAPEFQPVNELTGFILLIEDNLLAEHVNAVALLHGITVRNVEW